MRTTVRVVELLERADELAAIEAVVGRGGVLVIEGGAGIGKTSLLAAASERAGTAGHVVMRARGSELEAGFPFGVVLQLFERRIAEAPPAALEALFAGPAAAARPLLTGQLGEAPARDVSFAVLHGLYWLAVNHAAVRPLVIAVDDIHWADAPSLRWLAYLAARIEGLKLSLLVAMRPSEPASEGPLLRALRAGAAVVHPGLLSEGAVAAIVHELLGHGATDELCAAAWRESGGNPFYLHELLRARGFSLAQQPSAPLRGGGDSGLSREVAGRVRRLDQRALPLAQALAVLGDECELRQAAAVAGLGMRSAARLAAGLVRMEILAGDDPPRFLHPVVRDAVEGSLGSDGRDAAHRAAARLLYAEGAPPGKVAAHLLRVRPGGDSWVVARLREAGRAAIESGAPQTGAELLGRALEEPPASTERVAVLREAAAAEALAGRDAACALLEQAARLVADRHERAEIHLELAEALANLYRWADAADVCERALADLGEDDAELAARLEAELIVCGLRDARHARRVLPVLDRLGSRRLEGGTAQAYAIARAMAALLLGRPAQDIAVPLEEAFRAIGPRAQNWDVRLPGIIALVEAEGFSAAEATLEGMMTEVTRSGSARGLHVAYVTLALLKLRLGALPEADAAARVALRVLQEADFSQGLPLVATVLSDVAVEAGDLAEAEAALALLPADLPPAMPTMVVPAARGRLRLAQSRWTEALEEFDSCRSLFGAGVWGMEVRDSFLHARSGAAMACLRLGEHGRAHELAAAELADAREFGAPRALGVALRTAGLVEGGARGLELLEDSVAVMRDSPALLERARSLAEFGAALRRLGQRAAAREPLADALELAARCGARPLAARVREELKATGARPRSEWRTGVEALTPSELRVARLAADGSTNREIAQTLYVTVKTVESHIARVYEKLEIAGRPDLIRGLYGEKIRVPTP
jgi:DNA-binding CsgD family transcriptional regulator